MTPSDSSSPDTPETESSSDTKMTGQELVARFRTFLTDSHGLALPGWAWVSIGLGLVVLGALLG